MRLLKLQRNSMEFMTLLADVGIPIYMETYSVSLNWIGKFIGILVGAVSSVGVGIILFSLLLKLITLPFDIFQRISMRKQNIKMKEQQARMEKLQKQYANDKDTYNQKVMEMYKENGISTFSSCLPMILSMVIFFVAINAFNQYAAYSNVNNYNHLLDAYNASLTAYSAGYDAEGKTIELTQENVSYELVETKDTEGNVTGMTVKYTVKDSAADKYFYYTVLDNVAKNAETGAYDYTYDFAKAKAYIESTNKRDFYIDTAKVQANAEIWNTVQAAKAEKMKADTSLTDAQAEEKVLVEYFEVLAQDAVVVAYDTSVKNEAKFLWIKNIWVTDAAYRHPIMDYDKFSQEITERSSCSCKGKSPAESYAAYGEKYYENVTKKLDGPKGQANGYFILIALSIGTILLQQFVSMKSQKEQQKYSSVDGQQGGQQKMMMIMMTAMFAFFSFMYSSAFSMYLIVSNIFSLLSTLLINKVVDKVAEKKEEKALQEKYDRRFAGKAPKNSGAKIKKVKEINEAKKDKAVKAEKQKSDKKNGKNK